MTNNTFLNDFSGVFTVLFRFTGVSQFSDLINAVKLDKSNKNTALLGAS